MDFAVSDGNSFAKPLVPLCLSVFYSSFISNIASPGFLGMIILHNEQITNHINIWPLSAPWI